MAPFPYLPMMAIMVGLISQQVVRMSIFAYAGFMVEYLGAVDDKDKAGYYAGLLSSGFMIGRIFSSHLWGLVADRYGSRFVLIFGLVATALLSTAFGFSTTFVFAFVCRFLLGLSNGMMAAAKTLVSEVCGTEHATVGMGLITSAWSLGAVLGPGVGGMLAQPADHYPGTFSQDGMFGRNPYLLSNLVGAGLALVSLPLVLLHLRDPKAARLGSPPEKAWYFSWCVFARRGGDGDGNGGSHSHNRNGFGRDYGHTPPTDIDGVGSREASAGRASSWTKPKTISSTTTDGKCASTNGKRQPGTIPSVTTEEGKNASTNGKRQSVTTPSTSTDGKCASTNGKRQSAVKELGNMKPYRVQAETTPLIYDQAIVQTDGDKDRKPSWMQPVTVHSAINYTPSTSEHDTERSGPIPEVVKQGSVLAQRHIVILLLMEAVYSVSYSGFDEVYPLWALSSASKGGLEWSSQKIGQVFFTCGLMVLLFELVAVPYLTPWLGVRLSQRLGSAFEVPIYFIFPWLSRMGGGNLPVTLTALVLLFTCCACTNSFFVGTALAINAATGADRRGELNGISSMITSSTKALSPIISASLFAYSINSDHGFPVNHHLAFAFLGSMRLIAACIGWNRITDNGSTE